VVSGERVRDELVKILLGPRAGRGLLLLDETGLLGPLLPEVRAMKGVRQPPRFHPEGDVFAHTVRLLEEKDRLQTEGMLETRDVPGAEETWDAVTAFAVLLHDVGKPATFSVRDRLRFDGHQIEGARIARAVCDRLRFPSREREMIADCVENHMVFLDVARMRESTLKRLMRRRTFSRELTLHRLDCLASDGNLEAYDTLRRHCREFGEERISPPPLLTGRDLMAMGWREGPEIGRILAAIEEEQLENRLSTREEALRWLRGGAFRLPSSPYDATNGGATFRGPPCTR
jgi:poly(A) polymerase